MSAMTLSTLVRALATGLLLVTATGCGTSDAPAAAVRSGACAGAANDPPVRPEYPLGLACGWQFVSDIDTANVAFPDEQATYWVAVIPRLPGLRLRIDGRYPDARYFSYNAYDPLLRPVDAIADYELLPNAGGTNPFVVAGSQSGDYTAYVDFGAKPEMPAPNTIYAGEMDVGGQALPTPFVAALIYRIYVADPDAGADGGAGLPILTLETADGSTELLPYADCEKPLFPNVGGTLPALGINELLLRTEPPEELLGALSFPTAAYPPAVSKFHGLPNTVVRIVGNMLGMDLETQLGGLAFVGSGGGFLSNIHNAYVTTGFARNYGNLFVWRAKAPTFPGDPRLAGAQEDLRYWSICQNEFVSQRFTACVADYQSHLDQDGYFTVVVSDPDDRPANATVQNGIDWLPWGPYTDGLLIYRHMLPAAGFASAIQNIAPGQPVAEVMGDYTPQGAYCSRQTFEAAGPDPARIFAACLEETSGRDPTVLLGVVPTPG
jgi:hypothetical protein